MPPTVTDANVTTRTGETGFRRVPLQLHMARTLYEFPLTFQDPEVLIVSHLEPSRERRKLAEQWLEIAALDNTLSEVVTRDTASATSTLISAIRDFFEALDPGERFDRGTYSPTYTRHVLFTKMVELKTADLPRRAPRAYVDRRTLEKNDAD